MAPKAKARTCWCSEDGAPDCLSLVGRGCMRRPGRPEFYTFDTEDGGLACIPWANVDVVKAAPLPDAPEAWYVIFLTKHGSAVEMGPMPKPMARQITSQVIMWLKMGPVVETRSFDLDDLRDRIEQAIAKAQAANQESPIIDPATGCPADKNGGLILVPEVAPPQELVTS